MNPQATRAGELDPDELRILKEIERWQARRQRGGIVSSISHTADRIWRPIDYLGDVVIPNAVFEKAAFSFRTVLMTLQRSSLILVQERSTVGKAKEAGLPVETVEDFRAMPIAYLDVLAQSGFRHKAVYTALQGACLGFGGQVLSLLDFPALVVVSLKMIFQIGLCYGYRPDSIGEKELALRIVSLALSSGDERPKEFQGLDGLVERLAAGTFSNASSLLATEKRISKFASTIAGRFVKRRVSRRFPIVGALIGFGSNYLYTRETATCAYMFYRKRFLKERTLSPFGESATVKI